MDLRGLLFGQRKQWRAELCGRIAFGQGHALRLPRCLHARRQRFQFATSCDHFHAQFWRCGFFVALRSGVGDTQNGARSRSYNLHFEANKTDSFAAAVEATTKAAIERANPPLLRADLSRVYRAEMELFNTVIQPYNGTVSVPFQIGFPNGEIKDTSMQMGLVGMAIPCAALLLRDGLERKDHSAIERATKVVDFWTEQAPNPSGVPKNWADFPAPDQVTFRNYPTHLRVASDGMQGALRAWDSARKNGIDKPQWLQFARSFGDFLVAQQQADGSWVGSWNFDGTPNQPFTNATTHPLAFLVDLSKATGDFKYQNAALRAGEFCLKTVNDSYSEVICRRKRRMWFRKRNWRIWKAKSVILYLPIIGNF